MNKKQVQKRVLQNGKPLALSKFAWDEKTKTFSSEEDCLVVDFTYISGCFVTTGSNSTVRTGSNSTVKTGGNSTVKTGWDSTVKTGSNSTVKTGWDSTVTTGPNSTVETGSDSTVTTGSHSTVTTDRGSTVTTGSNSTVKTGGNSTVKTGSNSTVRTGWDSTVTTGGDSTVTTGWDSTVTTGSDSTVTTGPNSTVETGSNSTVKTGGNSTVKTGSDSTVKTGWDSTVTTGPNSTVETGSDSTVKTGGNSTVKTGGNSTVTCDGEDIVIINRNVFEVIQPEKGQTIQVCPRKIPGHLVNGMLDGKPHILVDGILSEVISHKGNVYKVINRGEEKQSYIVQRGSVYSHGATLKEAKEGLKYKFENRDLSAYEDLTLESVVSHDEAMQMYHDITGACGSGTRYFVEQNKEKVKDEYTIAEIIKLTDGQYNHAVFVEFFNE